MEKIDVPPIPILPEVATSSLAKAPRNLVLGLLLFASGIGTGLLLSYFLSDFTLSDIFPQGPTPSSFDECVKAPGSMIQTSFPSTCVTREGVSFKEVLSVEDKQKLFPPTTFDECAKDPQSTVQYTYPGTCVTQSGTLFTQPTPTPTPAELTCGGITNKKCPEGYVCETTAMYPDTSGTCTPETTSLTYQCPATGWVDCEPPLVGARKTACSSEAMAWYQTNCPDFQGGAL